jgi:hypothetical protein
MHSSQNRNKLNQIITERILPLMKATNSNFRRTESLIKAVFRNTIFSAVIAILEASCAFAPPTIVHETIGPAFVAPSPDRIGFLTVYSATTWVTNDDGPSLLDQTDYDVYAADGTLFKQVANHDEEPARVTLPKGTYKIVAASDNSGMVSIPVAIETGRTTVVNLESGNGWKQTLAGIGNADLVRLPNGQPIGYRARANELSKRLEMGVAQSKRHPNYREPGFPPS